jgi:hypothetical protein
MPMTAMIATPRLEFLDRLVAADLEVARLREQFQYLERRLGRARRHLAGPDARTPLRRAYLGWVEGEHGEALEQLRVARMRAQALCRLD